MIKICLHRLAYDLPNEDLRAYNFKICSGFLKTDALAVARHAELQTVDARHTVFLQGFEPSDFTLHPCLSFAQLVLL